MTSEGLGEMFEDDSADTCAVKFPLVSMGGRVEGLACTDLGVECIMASSMSELESSKKLSTSSYIIFSLTISSS